MNKTYEFFNSVQATRFARWHDANIGTEAEQEGSVVTVFEITPNECKKLDNIAYKLRAGKV